MSVISYIQPRPTVVGLTINRKFEAEIATIDVIPVARYLTATAKTEDTEHYVPVFRSVTAEWSAWADPGFRVQREGVRSIVSGGCLLALDAVTPHDKRRQARSALRSTRIVTCAKREVGNAVVIKIDCIAAKSAMSDYHVSGRIDNFRVGWMSQAHHSQSGCTCPERIHIELFLEGLRNLGRCPG